MLYLYFFFPSLHAFSPSLAQSRTQPSTQQLIRPFSRTCDTRSRTPGPAHQGERMVPCRGRLVGGDEPGSSALSPDIHTQWVHSHTCLIAWPIGGGAHWWRPLESEDRRIVMVRGSSQFIIKVIFISAFCLYCNISRSLDFRIFGCPWFSPGRHPSFFCCRLK